MDDLTAWLDDLTLFMAVAAAALIALLVLHLVVWFDDDDWRDDD